jgi:glycosyltransferase involved in cell wall biosynthesis
LGVLLIKILWISPVFLDFRIDSASRLEIMEQLVRRGHELFFIALRSKKSLNKSNSQIKLFTIPLRKFSVISTLIFSIYLSVLLPLYLLKTRPKILVVESEIVAPVLVLSLPVRKFLGIKVVFDIRSPPVETKGFQGNLQIDAFNLSVVFARKFFDGITVLTPMMKKEISKNFSIGEENIVSWGSGVSTALFNPKNFNGLFFKQKWGLENKFVVFYHGSISQNRGIKETIEAMSIVKKLNPNIVLFIIGSGPYFDASIDLVKEKQLENFVLIEKAVSHDKIPEFIAFSNLCIIPLPDHHYWRCQSPLKLLEYLSMEKVVLVSDIPAHKWILNNNPCGVFMPSISPKEIAQTILNAFKNRDYLEGWGKIGRKVVESNYTWEKIAKELDDYFTSLTCNAVQKPKI